MAVAAVVCTVACFGQTDNSKSVIFYGVDFSCVNVVGASESESDFTVAFVGINNLLLSEPDKYDVGKMLKLNVNAVDNEQAVKVASSMLNFKNKKPSVMDLQSVVDSYPASDGNSLLIVAKELNKGRDVGCYVAVLYDNNHTILSTCDLTGKTGGFGLRNYWARTLYNGLNLSSSWHSVK